jgi:TolB protein
MRKVLLISFLALACAVVAQAQQGDWIRTGTGLGVEKIRMAVPDFKAATTAAQMAQLQKTFDDTLRNDLENAGIFEMVSPSFFPLGEVGAPADIKLDAWGNPPPNAGMIAFGNLAVNGDSLNMQGWLYDAKNAQNPQVLGKQYTDKATDEGARTIAHKFADEIIFRLGGGIAGMAESKIFFISARSGHKEVWQMDYDGASQTQVTKLGSITLSPRVSPDGARIAYSTFASGGPNIALYSRDLGRQVRFPVFGGTNISPAWSPDGTRLAFSSSRTGDPEIYTVNADGTGLKRLTAYRGPDVSPVWNPKTGAQIAFVSGRTGLPQIYVMDADGTNLQRLTNEGYAVSPSWSPNGQYLLFSWIRHYGPGAPGAQDIYIMDVASHQWVQLTHDGGRNDFPSWAPDGRHVVFQSNRTGREEVWTMLADGSQEKQVTTSGANTQPNWTSK